MKKLLLGSKNRIIVWALAAGILAVAVSWTMAESNSPSPVSGRGEAKSTPTLLPLEGAKWSKAILSVSNLSCGGCIDNIKKSVATLAGSGNVNVDLTSGIAEVMFDGNILKDPQTIAQVISEAGYPAAIQKTIAPQQLKAELDQAAEKAKTHIATVGRFNVPRKDFEIELGHARSRYEQIYGPDTFSSPKGKQLLTRIEAQIAMRLIDEAVKMQEVERAGYSIPQNRVEQALSSYAGERKITVEELKRNMESNGYPFDYFKRKFEYRVKLQSYLDEIVLAGGMDTQDRQQRYGNWLANARTLAKVVYYDKNLEALVKAGSGGCSSGGCSTSR